MTTEKPAKKMEDNFCYQKDFKYTHKNPYHDKLAVFDSFVLRDELAETNVGKWYEQFGNPNPVEVEIGSGYGEFMLEYCQKNPGINFIGLDHRFIRVNAALTAITASNGVSRSLRSSISSNIKTSATSAPAVNAWATCSRKMKFNPFFISFLIRGQKNDTTKRDYSRNRSLMIVTRF